MADPCRKAMQDRVLGDMLGSIQDTTGGGWKVLILDAFTTRILSSGLKMSDIQDCNVSVVEDLFKARQPLPMAAVYFITPSPDSINRLLQDFASKPLYQSVHVFFSSKVPVMELNKIKSCAPLLSVIKSLKESNLEYFFVDGRTVITDHPHAQMMFMGDQADRHERLAESEMESITTRLCTLLASLHEFPVVRFKKGKAPEAADPPGANMRSTLTQRLATKMVQKLDVMQHSGQLPAKETCELLILDRSYDVLAPLIHEWTYECMVYDLLKVDNRTYRYKGDNAGGRTEDREVILEESDTVWVNLRHTFIAEVYTQLSSQFKEFQSRNKAARLGAGGGLRENSEMSTMNMRALITALPQYREVLGKLSHHIQISSDLRVVTNERVLTDVGEIEQDLILGEKKSKDMTDFLAANIQHMSNFDKVRLLACYVVTHPEKATPAKLQEWQKIARLSQADMVLITNLALFGLKVVKQDTGPERGGSSFFGGGRKAAAQAPDALRRRKADDEGYALNRVDPLLKDILTDLTANRLPSDQFPYVRPPAPDSDPAAAAVSARTGRAGLTWTRRGAATEGSTGPAARRVLVFIVGGAYRSEMRVVHEMSKATNRDIILASTSVETPNSFLEHLRQMNSTGAMYGV